MAVKPIPAGYHSITPYLVAAGASKLIDFLKQAFDAKEVERMATPDGTIRHAELKIGDLMLMLSEGSAEWKPMPCALYLYVTDADTTYRRALAAGGTSLNEPTNQFYGDRGGGIKDPSGNTWWIGTHVEDVSREEMMRRAEAQMKT
jgi:PhnB protein